MRIWWAIAIVMALAASAMAQPWAQGISESQKAAAQKKLEEGNNLFLGRKYKEALEAYTEATRSWDHPAIRFNMVRCLIQLDRPVDASDELTKALRFGKDPFDQAIYNEALNYQKLLASQIAEVEISCSQSGAQITLDGQKLMACPGKEKRRVTPGQHGIVATKDGYLTKNVAVVVVGGKTEAVDVKLVALDQAARIVHRWPAWIPWVVFGGGLAVAGVGGLIELNARDFMDDYDSTIGRECMGMGCDLSDPKYASLVNKRKKAEFRDKVALSVMTVGAVGVVAGGVMLVLNRGQTVYDNSAEKRGPAAHEGDPRPNVGSRWRTRRDPLASGPRLDFVPHDDGGVLTLSGRF